MFGNAHSLDVSKLANQTHALDKQLDQTAYLKTWNGLLTQKWEKLPAEEREEWNRKAAEQKAKDADYTGILHVYRLVLLYLNFVDHLTNVWLEIKKL